MDEHRNKLTYKIIFSLISGIFFGLICHQLKNYTFLQDVIFNGVLLIFGEIFIASLKMLIVPLVFVSLVCGVQGLQDLRNLGKIGGLTLLYYMLTTACAISLSLLVASFFEPGVGFNLPNSIDFSTTPPPPLTDVFINLVPSNPIKAAADGKMLQIIIFAILVGLGIFLSSKEAQKVHNIFEELNVVFMKIVSLLMALAPIGVFSLVSKVFFEQGISAFSPLISYFFVVTLSLFLHVFLTYSTLLLFVAKINPLDFLKIMRPVMTFAFSIASSNITIPLTLETLTTKLKIPKSIAAFTVPLGATINMDGTAIMQGVATIFISQAYGIEISLAGYVMVILTATLASIGTAGVPGVGLITLATVLKQAGLPVEGIGLIIGVDRILDMVRTSVNVLGDAVVTCVVAHYNKAPSVESLSN